MIHPRDMQYLGNEFQSNYDKCTSEYHSKPRYRVHVGVELLYEHIGTPRGFLTKRSPSPKAKRTRQRSVQEVRQNNLAFQMNPLIREGIKEVILCFLITEPNRIRGKRKRRRTTMTRILDGTNFLGAMIRRLNEREREREREKRDTERRETQSHSRW